MAHVTHTTKTITTKDPQGNVVSVQDQDETVEEFDDGRIVITSTKNGVTTATEHEAPKAKP